VYVTLLNGITVILENDISKASCICKILIFFLIRIIFPSLPGFISSPFDDIEKKSFAFDSLVFGKKVLF
jgi:hypothetical protein